MSSTAHCRPLVPALKAHRAPPNSVARLSLSRDVRLRCQRRIVRGLEHATNGKASLRARGGLPVPGAARSVCELRRRLNARLRRTRTSITSTFGSSLTTSRRRKPNRSCRRAKDTSSPTGTAWVAARPAWVERQGAPHQLLLARRERSVRATPSAPPQPQRSRALAVQPAAQWRLLRLPRRRGSRLPLTTVPRSSAPQSRAPRAPPRELPLRQSLMRSSTSPDLALLSTRRPAAEEEAALFAAKLRRTRFLESRL